MSGLSYLFMDVKRDVGQRVISELDFDSHRHGFSEKSKHTSIGFRLRNSMLST